jgi:hypothetical protein
MTRKEKYLAWTEKYLNTKSILASIILLCLSTVIGVIAVIVVTDTIQVFTAERVTYHLSWEQPESSQDIDHWEIYISTPDHEHWMYHSSSQEAAATIRYTRVPNFQAGVCAVSSDGLRSEITHVTLSKDLKAPELMHKVPNYQITPIEVVC